MTQQSIELPNFRTSKIEIIGHDFANGYLLNPKDRYSSKLSSLLGGTEYNYSANNSILSKTGSTNDGSYQVRQRILRPRTTWPYVPESDTIIIDFGLRDLESYGIGYLDAMKHSIRASIAWARASGVFQFQPSGTSHSSITYSGSWLEGTSTVYGNSGTGFRFAFALNSYFQIVVPQDFPGGEIGIGWILPASSGNHNSTYTIDITGATTLTTLADFTTNAATNAYSTNNNFSVTRIQNLNPGAHTIKATLTSLSGFGIAVDHWYIPAQPPPLIVVMKQPLLGNSSGNLSDDNINTLNETYKSVCEEFTDGSVLFAPAIEAVQKQSRYIIANGTNWNEAGSTKVAENLAYNILNKHSSTEEIAYRAVGSPGWTPLANNFLLSGASQYSNFWADATVDSEWSIGGYVTKNNGFISLAGRLRKTSATVNYGELISVLPSSARPYKRHTFLVNATPGSSAKIEVYPDGKMTYADGSITTGGTIDLDNIEYPIA